MNTEQLQRLIKEDGLTTVCLLIEPSEIDDTDLAILWLDLQIAYDKLALYMEAARND